MHQQCFALEKIIGKCVIHERSRNIITSNDEDIPERVPYSIIFAYYLKGKKRFSQLKYNS